jgi:hypothetical protein
MDTAMRSRQKKPLAESKTKAVRKSDFVSRRSASLKSWLAHLLILGSFILSPLSLGDPCQNCTNQKNKILENSKKVQRLEELIQKNQKVLEKLAANDVSRKIKINSNLLTAGLIIARLRDEEPQLKLKTEEACKQCPNL